MIRSFKYRIYPTKSQETILDKTLEECRWLYNNTLAYRISQYEEGISESYYKTVTRIPILKIDRPSLKNVFGQVLQNVVMRVDLAYQNFYRRVLSGAEKPGFPRFKGPGRYDSITYTQNGMKLIGSTLKLSRIGNIKIKLDRPIEGTIRIITVRKSSTGKWYVSVACAIEHEIIPTENTEIVGIDLGISSFLTTDTAEKIENPRFFKAEVKELTKADRKHSKQKSPKTKKVKARIHERMKFKRDNFTHQLSRFFVNRYKIICLEDIKINKLIENNYLAKEIANVSWGEFIHKLLYKAEDADVVVVQINPAYTSQDCSTCGYRVFKELGERVHDCPNCGLVLDRDVNAALNILALGLQSLG